MSRIFLIAALIGSLTGLAAPRPTPPSGRDIIKKIYDRYAGHWYRSFSFNQTTEIYRNDSLKTTQTWYEFIRYPDRFRMDFGSADSGNAAIFRGDSCYRFRNFQLKTTTLNNDEGLTFLLGGMFFYTLDQAYATFDALHYDLGIAGEATWKDRPVYVIGKPGGNQLFFDKENGYLVRMIRAEDPQKMDAWFESYQPFAGAWSETQCTFYINGKLAQVEIYHDCKANPPLGDAIFDPSKLIRTH